LVGEALATIHDAYEWMGFTANSSVGWDLAVWPPEHHWISTTRTSRLFLLIANHRDWLGFIPLSLNQEPPWLCVCTCACTCVQQG